MDYKAAREWAEEHMDADDYQAEFGEVSEGGDERTVLSISLDAATADRIRKQAQEAGISVSALIASKFRDKDAFGFRSGGVFVVRNTLGIDFFFVLFPAAFDGCEMDTRKPASPYISRV
jgi:hypothetical protein